VLVIGEVCSPPRSGKSPLWWVLSVTCQHGFGTDEVENVHFGLSSWWFNTFVPFLSNHTQYIA
jgi:hypothetical protein